MQIDPLTERVLRYLADRYLPVASDWVETRDAAQDLDLHVADVNARCQTLVARGLIELSPPDEEHAGYAALITNKGLLAIGRAP